MAKRIKFTISDNISLPLPSADDLRGRQSVRATFKLSSRAIDALSIVAVHLGIKQKSLFDQLIEDAGSLSLIANEIESEDFHDLDRVQKTYVISRKTLRSLEDISREFNAPRDALVFGWDLKQRRLFFRHNVCCTLDSHQRRNLPKEISRGHDR